MMLILLAFLITDKTLFFQRCLEVIFSIKPDCFYFPFALKCELSTLLDRHCQYLHCTTMKCSCQRSVCLIQSQRKGLLEQQLTCCRCPIQEDFCPFKIHVSTLRESPLLIHRLTNNVIGHACHVAFQKTFCSGQSCCPFPTD